MIARYEAVLMVWAYRRGCWEPRSLGHFRTMYRATARLLKVRRWYTRYERHEDFGEVWDTKTGKTYAADIDASFNVPTIGDLGWTP